MRVLIIPSWFPQKEDPLLGIFFKEQALALSHQNVQVGVIYPELRPLRNISWKLLRENTFQTTIDQSSIPTLRLHGWNLFPKMIKKQMQAWISAAKKLFAHYVSLYGMPDLIHAHSFLWGGLAAAAIHKKWGVPFFVTEHRNHFIERIALKKEITHCWTYQPIKEACSFSSGIIGVSSLITETLRDYGEDQEKYHTIANSVDTEFFKPTGEKRQGRTQFISVAQLEERKNLSMLLRCFQRFLQKRPDSCLVILGEGEERPKLERLAVELGIQERLSMPGKVDRATVKKALAESHAFLFSSNSEAFGVALIEAFAAGLPVLSTRCGGPESFMNESVGLMVPKRDEEAFFQGMITLMDSAFCEKTIRNYAKEHFHDEAIAAKYKSLYSKVL
jgi:glycosyltransferase involved in cell wall biosynthesis